MERSWKLPIYLPTATLCGAGDLRLTAESILVAGSSLWTPHGRSPDLTSAGATTELNAAQQRQRQRRGQCENGRPDVPYEPALSTIGEAHCGSSHLLLWRGSHPLAIFILVERRVP